MGIHVVAGETRKQATPDTTTIDVPESWDVGDFTDDEIAAAVAKIKAFPGYPADDNLIASFWPQPKKMPSIAEVDFGDIAADTVNLADLLSSNRTMKRDRLLWHAQRPGQRLHDNPFTIMPLVMTTKQGVVIVDGHHSLGSLWLLGAKTAPVWQLPTTPGSPNAA